MVINSLLSALEPQTIIDRVEDPHNNARLRYQLRANRVESYEEFCRIIGDYYAFHSTQCVAVGGKMTDIVATSRAKDILAQHYKREGGDINSAFKDASDGTNGGMSAILNYIADDFRQKAVNEYVQDMFDRHVKPYSLEERIRIIRELLQHYREFLSPTIDVHHPEFYGHEYKDLVLALANARKSIQNKFRHL